MSEPGRLILTDPYICRSSNKMPSAVKQVIKDSFVLHGGKTLLEADGILKKLEDEGRLYEECWS